MLTWPYLQLSFRIMDKQTPLNPPIDNAADYVDALIRPQLKDRMFRKKIIAGRRMRDKYRDEVVVTEVLKHPG
jgi:hypothetical protein